jgi:hypothetical protein
MAQPKPPPLPGTDPDAPTQPVPRPIEDEDSTTLPKADDSFLSADVDSTTKPVVANDSFLRGAADLTTQPAPTLVKPRMWSNPGSAPISWTVPQQAEPPEPETSNWRIAIVIAVFVIIGASIALLIAFFLG